MDCGENIVFQIRTVSNLIKRRMKEIVKKNHEYNVTGIHIHLTKYLIENQDKEIFQKDIEEEFCIRRSTVTAILNLMEKNDIIKRERVDYDARLKKTVLTEKAKEINKNIYHQILDMEKSIFKGLDEQEVKNFCEVLKKIKNNIN